MIVLFDRSFEKSLDKLKDNRVKSRVKALIESMERSNSINDIKGVKAMKGHIGFYRVRIGDQAKKL